jgi:aspartyl-tRNA(Asn)/glutamyl-tRNA(Gln) amidotransferase subunit B
VSVHKPGTPFGTRTETKNLNSFRNVERAVEYETDRQIAAVEKGERIRQETRGWDEAKQRTYPMRSKEDADEYRYFPEPDLPPLVITKAMVADQAKHLDLLPNILRKRLTDAGLPAVESEVLVSDPAAARIWDEVSRLDRNSSKFAFNWLIGDAVKISEEKGQNLSDSGISESSIVMVSKMVADGRLSSTNAKFLMRSLWEQGIGLGANKPLVSKGAEWIVEVANKQGLLQDSDEAGLAKVVDEIIDQNPQAVADFKSGNQRAFGALVGAAMKATKGRGNPPLITKLLKNRLQ